MKWALVDERNIVRNVIVYNGVDKYTPPEGLRVMEVNDWVEKEEGVDKAAPPPSPPYDDAARKVQRDDLGMKNIALVASFEIEKKSNPALEFSAYLDMLETKIDKS